MFFHQILSFFPRVKMEYSRFIVSSVFEYQLHKPPNLGIITPEPVIDPAQIRICMSCPEIALHSNLSGWRKKSQKGEKIPLVRIPTKDERNQRC